MYASAYGVTFEEATRRLELQKEIGILSEKLETKEADTFAGLWVEHEPEFRVFTRFTRNGTSTIRSYTKGGPLEDLVSTKPAKATLEELSSEQYKASRELEARGIRNDSTVDVKENKVKLFVAEAAKVKAIHRSQDIRLPEKATVAKVPKLSQPSAYLYGGRWLYLADSRPWCTAGFSVKHSSGRLGTTTAGHCPPNPNVGNYRQLYFSYKRLPLVGSGRTYGPYDVQWHRPNGHVPIQRFWDGDSTRPVRGAKGWNRTYRGEWVCKYGLNTGSGCGQVRYKRHKPWWITNARATFIIVHSPNNYNLSGGGDSGGPMFYGNTAYGILSGSASYGNRGNIDVVYMPINFVTHLGLRIRW